MDKIAELREKANKLPLLPGVYIMKDAAGAVIYVGKAKALKNRVTSYFRGEHLPKVAAMVSHVDDFDVIVAASEFEALVLENSLIKRHMPHYNILLRDDKTYPFLRLDEREPYPSFTIVNKVKDDGARYFGPYGGRGVSKGILGALAKALKVRKFALVSDVPGLLKDPADPSTLFSTLHLGDVETLKADGVISGGMLPKIESCADAIRAGVKKVHLVDGRMAHSLLLEIFTREGVGTEITE